ncbi:MAG: hypothetical protein ACP5PJ_08160 [Acidimicrobiales bacterium]
MGSARMGIARFHPTLRKDNVKLLFRDGKHLVITYPGRSIGANLD